MEVALTVEALIFLFLGMFTVGIFLIYVTIGINIQAKILTHFFLIKEILIVSKGSRVNKSSQDTFSMLAAYAASIQTYKKSK